MQLTELEPEFIRYENRNEGAGFREWHIRVTTFAEAQGLLLLCPKCFAEAGSNIGVHLIQVTFADKGVPDELGSHNKAGKPTRWNVTGTGYADLTTTPSILIESGCKWHGFITNGEIK
jgi:hypothetical protein